MKKRDIFILVFALAALVAVVLIVRAMIPTTDIIPNEKSLEEIKAEIDNLCLDETGTTYYGDWMISKSEVREYEQLRLTLGLTDEEIRELQELGCTTPEVSEAEWVDLMVGLIKEGSNWVDLYNAGVFDCSEMSALFECWMEQFGYPTCIVKSDKYKHAWCLVEMSDGSLLPVECTGMCIPWEGSKIGSNIMTWADYFVYDMDKRFETIYEAEYYCRGDYDWWNSTEVFDWTFDEVKMDEFVSEWLKENVSFECLVIDETEYLKYGQYWSVPKELEEGYEIEVTVEVKQGGPIDVLLLDSGNYLAFEQFMEGRGGTFKYFVAGSALNVMSKSYKFQVLVSDRYYVVISNAGRIEGGASPKGDASIYLKVVATVRP